MTFDIAKFLRTELIQKTKEVEIRPLQYFFDEGERPIFLLRGLTAEEMAQINEMVGTIAKNVNEVLAAMESREDVLEQLKNLVSYSSECPDEIKRRLEQLRFCCISPKLDLDVCKKIAKCYPIEFYELTATIINLTREPPEIKK